MPSHEYRLFRYAKKHDSYYYGHLNNLLSYYNEPKYIKGGFVISSNVSLVAVGIPEKIAAALSKAKTTEDIQNGLKEYYAVFNNENGDGWGEVALLDTKEGLASFVTWACGLNPNDDNDDLAPVVYKDPLRAPKAFKRWKLEKTTLIHRENKRWISFKDKDGTELVQVSL